MTKDQRIKQLECYLQLAIRYIAKATEMGAYDGCVIHGSIALRNLEDVLNNYTVDDQCNS